MTKITSEDLSALIRAFEESEWKELALETDGSRIFISRDQDTKGAPWQSPRETVSDSPAQPESNQAQSQPPPLMDQSSPAQKVTAPVPEDCLAVTAPNLGIFYRSPKPGAPPYVELGMKVGKDTEICLIEVMKLFTPVQAGVEGTIQHICVDDGEMVDHGQPLFYVKPDA